jgi:hypothetical protein
MFRPRFATESTHSPVRGGSGRPGGDALPAARNLRQESSWQMSGAVAADGNIDRFVELPATDRVGARRGGGPGPSNSGADNRKHATF